MEGLSKKKEKKKGKELTDMNNNVVIVRGWRKGGGHEGWGITGNGGNTIKNGLLKINKIVKMQKKRTLQDNLVTWGPHTSLSVTSR